MHAFKEGIRPEIMAIGSGRGRRLKASWRRFLGHGRGFNSAENELQFCFKKGLIFGTIGPRSGHDRATIGPRLGHNLSPGRSSVVVRSSGDDPAAEGARSRFDRATIEPFFHLYSLPSDEDLIVMTIPTVRWRSDISDASTRCFGSRKIPTVHAASNACKKNQ